MTNCFCCLSQNAMVCLSHCRQELQQVLKNCKTFSSRPRPNVQDLDQDQDLMIQDQDQDFHFCLRVASRSRPWSRGLYHCQAVDVQFNIVRETRMLFGLQHRNVKFLYRLRWAHPVIQLSTSIYQFSSQFSKVIAERLKHYHVATFS